MSKCQDELDMSVCAVYKSNEIQMRVTLSATAHVTDIKCELHLPKGAVWRSSSILPDKVEETTVTWVNPIASLWDVVVAPLAENMKFIATGRKGDEIIRVERIVRTGAENGAQLISARLAVLNRSGVMAYRPGDVLEVEMRLRNCGTVGVSNIFGSHMIRDYLAYIPDSLHVDRGEVSLVFRLVRWHISLLSPGEEAILSFQTRAQEGNPQTSISFGATYTFQALGNMYGPYEAKGFVLPKQ